MKSIKIRINMEIGKLQILCKYYGQPNLNAPFGQEVHTTNVQFATSSC